MFKINKNHTNKSDIPLIVNEYISLHIDGDDVLFTGLNKFGHRILGSLVEENYRSKFQRYFHILVKDADYINFRKQRITYRDLLKRNKTIYVIDKNFNNSIKNQFEIDFQSIPLEYLPLEESYCPKSSTEFSLSYILKLTGKLANEHKAVVKDLVNVQLNFEKILNKAISFIESDFKFRPYIYQLAIEPGSIKFGYDISIDFGGELFKEDNDLARYINSFLEYSLINLPDDIDVLIDKDKSFSENLKLFKSEIENIYKKASIIIPDELENKIRNELIDSITDFGEISSKIGESFDEIELYNGINSPEPMGIINKEYKESIVSTKGIIEEFIKKEIDNLETNRYRIFIYHLNVNSRTGNAKYEDEKTGIISEPKISISGDESLHKSKYARSLYENMYIDVLAKAKIENGKIRRMTIIFENS